MIAVIAMLAAALTFAQPQAPASASPPPAPQTPDTEGGFDLSKLTPEQREALKLAIIKISQNPVGNITAIPFQNNFNYGVGPYTRYQYNLNIQPVIPFMLSKNMSLVSRTIFPVIVQPSFAPPTICATQGCGSTFGIADTQEQLFFAPKTKPDQLIWAVGPIFSFPTGSPQNILGTAKWGAGLDAVALVTPGKWVMGALVTQTWSFAGTATAPSYSNFLVQPFINYNLPHGWALTTAPSLTASWQSPTTKWAIPVGAIISNTFKTGDQIMQLSVGYYTFVERPVAQPQTQLRFQWTLLWPVKRGIDINELLQEAK
jgi:hypothetical protein